MLFMVVVLFGLAACVLALFVAGMIDLQESWEKEHPIGREDD